MTKPRIKLEWGPKEIEDLKVLVGDLKDAIENAPCEVSRFGELTYECRHDRMCRVCTWRNETLKLLIAYETR